jgi:ribosomal protein S12 methylthiotransferase accessory factor
VVLDLLIDRFVCVVMTNQCSPVNLWIESLVGPHFGLIEDLQRVLPEPDDVPLAVFAGRLAHTRALGALDAPQLASGAALDAEQACAACIGEAVERYAAAWVPHGSVVHARASDLCGEAILPDAFALFAPRQYRQSRRRFPFRRWRPDDSLVWLHARSLVDDRRAWVPAVFVFQPYMPADGEPLIAPCLSTGLACSTSRTGAVVSGLCEVIERDAVALAWLGTVQPPVIELSDACAETAAETAATAFARSLTERGFCWRLLDLTTDVGVPVAAAIIEGHSPVGWIVAFGSACHPHPARACLKALVEAAHCRMYVKSLVREQPRGQAGRRFQNVTSFADHARFYTSHPEHRQPLDWMCSGTRTVRWELQGADPDGNWLCQQAARLAEAGYEPFAVDLEPPDVAGLGLHVARVLVPGLHPLHGHHGWRHLGGRRLRELRRVFGPWVKQPWRYNRYPHPCP